MLIASVVGACLMSYLFGQLHGYEKAEVEQERFEKVWKETKK